MKKAFCFSVLLLLLGSFPKLYAQKTFLKAIAPAGEYGGLIKGGATQRAHEDEILVLSYSSGLAGCTPSFSRAGAQACKPSVGNLSFLMELAPGTNQLKYHLLTGLHLTSADFVFEKGAESPFAYYKIHMEDVVVVSVQESGSSETPVVSVELAAGRIAWAIYEQTTQGNAKLVNKVGFNLATNTIWQYAF